MSMDLSNAACARVVLRLCSPGGSGRRRSFSDFFGESELAGVGDSHNHSTRVTFPQMQRDLDGTGQALEEFSEYLVR